MDIEKLPVHPFLIPEPRDENQYCEPEWFEGIPGFINEKDPEDDCCALLRDSNIRVYDGILDLTQQEFRKGLEVMAPHLEDLHFNSLQIGVDVLGMMIPNEFTLACYNAKDSKPQKGVYVFNLTRQLLFAYWHYQSSEEALPVRYQNMWVHELIHLIDHQQLAETMLYRNSNSTSENFKYFLWKFREEGIASLYDLLCGERDLKSMDEAISVFRERVKTVSDRIAGLTTSDDELRDEIYGDYSFYSAGPWLVLAAMEQYLDELSPGLFTDCIAKLERGETLPAETFHEVLQLALRYLRNDEFISYAQSLAAQSIQPLAA